MITFTQLTDEVLLNLQGDSLDQSEQTFLTSAIDDETLTFTVDEPSLISQGLVEIDDELVWVKSVDRSTGVVTVSSRGRGFRSTIPTSHEEGAMVVNNPRYSRYRVKQTINTTIQGVYPDLYSLATMEFPYVAARDAYELPADVDQVHSVYWESIGPSRVWIAINQYEYIPNANTTRFPTGRALYIWDGVVPGRTVRVTYIKSPSPLIGDDDVFETVTGLASTAKETIIHGTCYRLLGFLEPPRLQTGSVESSQRSDYVPVGSGVNAGKFFYSLYLEALQRERERLLRSNPVHLHRTRRLL